jgi:carbonic anhydrase
MERVEQSAIAPAPPDMPPDDERGSSPIAPRGMGPAPALGLAIVACMDARLDPQALFGLRPGDAHVIRNAGAIVTDDVIRSLALSQHVLGTRAVILLAHTGCALEGLDAYALRSRIVSETGHDAPVDFGPFDDLEAHVRAQVERLAAHPWSMAVSVQGLVYDVATGRLRQVA